MKYSIFDHNDVFNGLLYTVTIRIFEEYVEYMLINELEERTNYHVPDIFCIHTIKILFTLPV